MQAQGYLMAEGEKAGFRALRMALQVRSEEWGVVNRVCTLLLATSCNPQTLSWRSTEA